MISNSDKEAFEKWWEENTDNKDDVLKGFFRMAWQAAISHERARSHRLVEALKRISEIGYYHDYGDHRAVASKALAEYKKEG